jgi:RsiW-degrading membrane proteinase PrsW (M82 family)
MVLIDLLMILFSISVAYIPLFFYVAFVWWLDRYDREPISLVLTAFIWGAVGSIILSIILEVILGLPLISFPELIQVTSSSVFIAPFVEEVAKALLLFLLFFYYKFDNLTDGIVYGAIVGFGFAASENLLYFVRTYFDAGLGVWVVSVISRIMFSSVAHGIFTSVTGAGLGIAKSTNKLGLRSTLPVISLAVAIALHSLFNLGIVLAQLSSLFFMFLSFSLVPLGVILALTLVSFALRNESACIKRQLLDEVEGGFITRGEYDIVPNYLMRKKAGRMVFGKYDSRSSKLLGRLFHLETRLAFEKDRLILSGGGDEVIKRRIKEIREEITRIQSSLGSVVDDLQELT